MTKNRVYGYARISKDDEDKRESIETQIEMIETYCRDKGLILHEIFSDNDVSGLTFDRPQFNILKGLIDQDEVDTLILKDLSRLGRNSARVSDFLDMLQVKQIRLILISDNHDGIFAASDSSRDMLDMKSLFNQFYSRDLSRKITSNMRQIMKRKEGLVLIPSYGYYKDPLNKNNLLIDDEAAEVVRYIFSLYLNDYGAKNISKILNDKNIDTPSVHRAKKNMRGNNPAWKTGHLWYATSITKILSNDVYVGTLRCGVTKKTKIKGNSIATPEEEHIIHLDHHESIITKETFERAQQVRENRQINKTKGTNKKIHKYAGLLKCGDCGNGFVVRKWTTKTYGLRKQYRCTSYHKYGKCTDHGIMENEMDSVIFDELSKQLELNKHILENYDKTLSNNDEPKLIKDLKSYELEYQQKNQEIKNYSRQLAKGLIDEDMFLELSGESKKRIIFLKDKINQLREMSDKKDYHKKLIIKSIDFLREVLNKNDLSNGELASLIEKIIVTEAEINGELGVDIEIVWKEI